MKTFRKFISNEDHVWYESSNIVYSVYFNGQTDGNNSLKIVFKGGRTYLYKNVMPDEYVQFRDAESQGKVFNSIIKNHECIKKNDTNLDSLEEMRQKFVDITKPIDLNLRIDMNDKTGEFQLYQNDVKIFEAIENQFSIQNLFMAMGLGYAYSITDNRNETIDDFEEKEITI